MRYLQNDLRKILKVYFIMGSTNCQHKNPREVLKEAIQGGITCFQFREKGIGALVGQEKFELAKDLQQLCQKAGIPFIVNDDIDLAIALDADGVHIGQDDEDADTVRAKIKDKILGLSVHNLLETKRAIEAEADYVGVGPIFPTNSKVDAQEVKGVEIIQELRANGMSMPMVGIGGITIENAASVIRAGADGVSVISTISQADQITLSAQRLKDKVLLYE